VRADELYPGDASSVLHFDNKSIFVAADIEYHTIIAINAGVADLILHLLRVFQSAFNATSCQLSRGALASSYPPISQNFTSVLLAIIRIQRSLFIPFWEVLIFEFY
jgi:hypothetical protein